MQKDCLIEGPWYFLPHLGTGSGCLGGEWSQLESWSGPWSCNNCRLSADCVPCLLMARSSMKERSPRQSPRLPQPAKSSHDENVGRRYQFCRLHLPFSPGHKLMERHRDQNSPTTHIILSQGSVTQFFWVKNMLARFNCKINTKTKIIHSPSIVFYYRHSLFYYVALQ